MSVFSHIVKTHCKIIRKSNNIPYKKVILYSFLIPEILPCFFYPIEQKIPVTFCSYHDAGYVWLIILLSFEIILKPIPVVSVHKLIESTLHHLPHHGKVSLISTYKSVFTVKITNSFNVFVIYSVHANVHFTYPPNVATP